MNYVMIFQFVAICIITILVSWGIRKTVSNIENPEEFLEVLDTISMAGMLFVNMTVTDEDTKEIFRIVGSAMRYAEETIKDTDNEEKEELVVDIVISAIAQMFPDSEIDVDIARKLIKLSVAFSESTFNDSIGEQLVKEYVS